MKEAEEREAAALLVVVGIGVVLFVYVLYPGYFSNSPISVTQGMKVILHTADGRTLVYTKSNFTQFAITVGTTAVSSICMQPTATMTYTGAISSGSYSASWSAFSDTDSSVALSAPAGSSGAIGTTFPSGGQWNPLNSWCVSATALSVGAYGTYVLSMTASVTASLTFTDGTSSSKTSTGSGSVTYSYSSSNAINTLQVSVQ